MTVVQIATRVDEDIKSKAVTVLSHYGLDIPTALKMFVTQIANERRIPLDISQKVIRLDEILAKIPKIRFKVEKNGHATIPQDFPEWKLNAWEM